MVVAAFAGDGAVGDAPASPFRGGSVTQALAAASLLTVKTSSLRLNMDTPVERPRTSLADGELFVSGGLTNLHWSNECAEDPASRTLEGRVRILQEKVRQGPGGREQGRACSK